jgi:hypothetical protein
MPSGPFMQPAASAVAAAGQPAEQLQRLTAGVVLHTTAPKLAC